jgi:hypothetical protein
MGVPAREAGDRRKEPTMKTTLLERRHQWQSLSRQDKQQRLESLRTRHQRQVAFEILRLQSTR